jgi:hypothetical protein
MANDVKIKRTVFNSSEFSKVVGNRSFSTFVQPVSQQDLATVEEFFSLYEKLYYEIDVTGETNSHEYLVKKSSELLDFVSNTEDIQPLLDEIAQLREQNLELNQQILDIQNTQ